MLVTYPTFRRYIYIIFQRLKVIMKLQNSRNQGFFLLVLLNFEGSGSVPLTMITDPDPGGPKCGYWDKILFENREAGCAGLKFLVEGYLLKGSQASEFFDRVFCTKRTHLGMWRRDCKKSNFFIDWPLISMVLGFLPHTEYAVNKNNIWS